MSRLADVFGKLKHARRTALVTYITAGDPDKNGTVPLMRTLVKAGADVLELGVPFSDPTADGPVIQQACERALKHGTTLSDVLAMVKEFRTSDAHTPIVLMGYLNPMEAYGIEAFAGAAGGAGVDGVLTVDMPPEEAEPLAGMLRAKGLDPVFLLAPTSGSARLKRICETASGFVYYVSLKGVTGAANLDVQDVRQRLAAVRRETNLPVGVGFGIRDAQTAAQLAGVADAVVVGSAIVSRIAEHQSQHREMLAQVSGFVQGLRQAMDAARV
ncbi:MAG: tryptophan synthase subunit alpha [Gammaproteobacteria bacterium]